MPQHEPRREHERTRRRHPPWENFTGPLQLFAQETRPRFVSNSRFLGEHSESSGKKYAHLLIKVSFSNCYYPRLWHPVSRASEVSGSTGCLGNRLRFVASTRSRSPGGDRPQRARISNGRGRSRFRYRCLSELYPRMDAARKGAMRRVILRRVARFGLGLRRLRASMRERFRSTERHPPENGSGTAHVQLGLDILPPILQNTESHTQEHSLTKPIRAKISALGT